MAVKQKLAGPFEYTQTEFSYCKNYMKASINQNMGIN